MLIRLQKPFPIEDIEWRIGQCGLKQDGTAWAKCLAYIQARAVMDRLDELYGPLHWNVSYTFIEKTGVIAKIGVYDAIENQWVYKEDGAEMTEIEAFKGGISSALKRAGNVWGIGRYLYKLESEFADVRMGSTPGYNFAKTKEGKNFWWRPPTIPDWALPAKVINETVSTITQQNSVSSLTQETPFDAAYLYVKKTTWKEWAPVEKRMPFDDVPPIENTRAPMDMGAELGPDRDCDPNAPFAEYKIEAFKDFIGLRLMDIDKSDLRKQIEGIKNWGIKNNRSIAKWKADIEAIETYLGSSRV